MSETWAILWTDHADIVGTYERENLARWQLAEFLLEHPEHEGEIGIQHFDETGHPSGERIYDP